MMHIIKRLFREKWKFSSDQDMFREYRIFVACEADEDVSYIAQYTGEDHLLIGSDYGHQDPSEERQLVAAMRAAKTFRRRSRTKSSSTIRSFSIRSTKIGATRSPSHSFVQPSPLS